MSSISKGSWETSIYYANDLFHFRFAKHQEDWLPSLNTLKFKCVDVKFGVQEHNDDINISLNAILSPHYNA